MLNSTDYGGQAGAYDINTSEHEAN